MKRYELDLIGTGEIKEQYGIDRMQVWRLMRQNDFPRPAVTLIGGVKVWFGEEVDEWVRNARRAGRLLENGSLVPPYLRDAS